MKLKALIATIALSVMAASANVFELPISNVDGKDYYYYEVKPNETLFSLSHKLQITQDEMIKYNPSISNGIEAGMKLYFPVAELGTAGATTIHKVKKGETLYSISNKYHISIDQLLILNPSAQDGLKEGQELNIKPVVGVVTPNQSNVQGELHTISYGETLYSIAALYKMTVEELLAMNPGLSVEKYNVGTVIRVKHSAPLIVTFDGASSIIGQSYYYTPRVQGVVSDNVNIGIADTALASINIALLMPFKLNEKTIDDGMRTTLDFYKGFILAADSLNNEGVKVKIYAYDTYNNADSVSAILSRGEMKNMNMIVTPANKETVAQVAELSDSIDTYVFNVFFANDTLHYTHKHMIQANIVRDHMYEKVAETLVAQYDEYIPVIIGTADDRGREDVANLIKAKYAEKGVTAIEITYEKKLTKTDLSQLDKSKKYIFIPVSPKEAAMSNYTEAIVEYKKEQPDSMTILFGYPEWTVIKGDRLKTLHSLNTVIYSRFYYDADSERCKDFESRFKAMFKTEVIKTTPVQAAIGFDTGWFLINALRQGNGNVMHAKYSYDGLQYGFDFGTEQADKAIENKSLFFIIFSPDGSVIRKMY